MSPSTPTPTGRRGPDDVLSFRRVLPLSLEDAWAAITDSDRAARWFGPWNGAEVPGPITVTMLAEDGAPTMPGEITEVVPLDHYVLRTGPEEAAMIGPGWDYYLDRLVAAETGQDPEAITFEPAYIPGLCEHYRGLYA